MNEKLEQRKQEILKELNMVVVDETFDNIFFGIENYSNDWKFQFSKREYGIWFNKDCDKWFKYKELRLIAELYEVMQYLGEV